jgi:hypothetical protein
MTTRRSISMLLLLILTAAAGFGQNSASPSAPSGKDEGSLFTTQAYSNVNVLGVSGGVVYMRSTVGAPWGVNTNELAMNDVFGAGNWQDLRYETANAATVFSAANSLIFMEGSDSNANEMEAFINANIGLIQAWVNNGGRLFMNAAPNEGDGMSYGFGGTSLVYTGGTFSASASASAGQSAHPIFNGPFTPAGTAYTGNWFGHATISCTGCTNLIDGSAPGVVLAEKLWGSGIVLFGGMTTTNWHAPQPNAHNLRRNILAYLGNVALTSPCGKTEGHGAISGNRTFDFFDVVGAPPPQNYVNYREVGKNLDFRSTAITSRAYTNTMAILEGHGFSLGVFHTFVLTVTDGSPDTFRIELYANGKGSPYVAQGNVVSGNIWVTQSPCS